MPNYMLDVISVLGLLRWLSGKESPSKQETRVQLLGWEDPLEKERATHPNILAWEIQRTEEPSGLQSVGWQRFGYDLNGTPLQYIHGKIPWMEEPGRL